MKIKKTTWFKILGFTGIIATFGSVFPFVLTSCSLEKSVNKFSYPTQYINGLEPTKQFLSLTIDTWKEIGQEHPTQLIQAIKNANYEAINKSGFDLENAMVYKVNSQISTEAPILSNLYIELINQQQNRALRIEIVNIYNVSSELFTPPSEFELTINQLDLKNVDNYDPQNITDTEWTNAINQYKNGFIPSNLYMLAKRNYNPDNQTQYLLTYEVNPIYNNLLGDKQSQFKPINITILVSPYLGKIEQLVFTFDKDVTSEIFGDDASSSSLIQQASTQGGQVEIYNKLSNYIIQNMPDIQPLRPCINDKNQTVYGFSIQQIKPSEQDICVISFRTNPNSESREFNYQFTLEMPK